MTTIELLEELSKQPKEEIEYALLSLLIKKKFDFITLNEQYVKYLEMQNNDKDLKLSDANTCTLSLLLHFCKENESNRKDIHWALYNLNESKQFNMKTLNKRFNYDKEKDCEYSFYYRESSRMH